MSGTSVLRPASLSWRARREAAIGLDCRLLSGRRTCCPAPRPVGTAPPRRETPPPRPRSAAHAASPWRGSVGRGQGQGLRGGTRLRRPPRAWRRLFSVHVTGTPKGSRLSPHFPAETSPCRQARFPALRRADPRSLEICLAWFLFPLSHGRGWKSLKAPGAPDPLPAEDAAAVPCPPIRSRACRPVPPFPVP